MPTVTVQEVVPLTGRKFITGSHRDKQAKQPFTLSPRDGFQLAWCA